MSARRIQKAQAFRKPPSPSTGSQIGKGHHHDQLIVIENNLRLALLSQLATIESLNTTKASRPREQPTKTGCRVHFKSGVFSIIFVVRAGFLYFM
mmetsp:Transcript_4600/g.11695  ORF Transcript_4600/g.11695 Transcript_4600/m.11695 type:complete len:95 (+) Transcript_4600:588-872(+)